MAELARQSSHALYETQGKARCPRRVSPRELNLRPTSLADVAAWVWSLIPPDLRRPDVAPGARASPTSRVFFVRQRPSGFVPSRVAARVGDMIVFINDDRIEHEVQELKKDAVSNVQKPFQWDRVVLTAPGTQRFECVPHGARFQVDVAP